MNVGIVGNGENKFTVYGAMRAQNAIRTILQATRATTVVSGHSPLGGVDLWAEEIGRHLGLPLDIKTPTDHSWGGTYGYRARNLDIARASDLVVVVLADTYPDLYTKIRLKVCYHCADRVGRKAALGHVKSGGCWTGWQARGMGKSLWRVVVANGRDIDPPIRIIDLTGDAPVNFLVLSEADQQALVDAMDTPAAAPNAALTRAWERHRK